MQIKRRVDKGKVGKQPFGAYPTGQLEKVVIGILRVEADAGFHLKNMNGEDWRFALAQAGLCG